MNQVYCFDPQGNMIAVGSQHVVRAPGAYGIMIEHGQVLLRQQPETGLWRPPGGLLRNSAETPRQHAQQHVQQVLGVLPVVGDLLYLEERNRIDGEGNAWQISAMYYALTRPRFQQPMRVETAGTIVEWIALSELTREMMQFGYEAVRAGQARLR